MSPVFPPLAPAFLRGLSKVLDAEAHMPWLTCVGRFSLICSFWDELARRLDDSIDDPGTDENGRPRLGSYSSVASIVQVISLAQSLRRNHAIWHGMQEGQG
jgi:hypothetical protein